MGDGIEDDGVEAFLATVQPSARREDARALAAMMARVTGEPPALSGSIIGFGRYRYRYASGREGEAFRASFAPRRTALVLYLGDGSEPERDRLVAALGPLKTGAGCLYVKRLADVDAGALERLVAHAYAHPPHAA